MSEWFDCLIGFGANLGNLEASLRETQTALANFPGVRSFVASPPLLTKAVGGTDQPQYLNAAFRLQTHLTARGLHELLAQLEWRAGRSRQGRWQPRTLDLDLLLYGTEVIETTALKVPHPRMSVRRFVLVPAVAIAADMYHPVAQQTLAQLLQTLEERPNRLVWVTDQQSLAHQVLEAIRSQWRQHRGSSESDSSAWSIDLANNQDSFESFRGTAKIVAWSNPRPQALRMARFAGPQIELSTTTATVQGEGANFNQQIISDLQEELVAAMEGAEGH